MTSIYKIHRFCFWMHQYPRMPQVKILLQIWNFWCQNGSFALYDICVCNIFCNKWHLFVKFSGPVSEDTGTQDATGEDSDDELQSLMPQPLDQDKASQVCQQFYLIPLKFNQLLTCDFTYLTYLWKIFLKSWLQKFFFLFNILFPNIAQWLFTNRKLLYHM